LLESYSGTKRKQIVIDKESPFQVAVRESISAVLAVSNEIAAAFSLRRIPRVEQIGNPHGT
jgi:hypothetical protein